MLLKLLISQCLERVFTPIFPILLLQPQTFIGILCNTAVPIKLFITSQILPKYKGLYIRPNSVAFQNSITHWKV